MLAVLSLAFSAGLPAGLPAPSAVTVRAWRAEAIPACRCGTNCPNGGNCASCGCAAPTPAEPPGKPGPGWHWDAAGRFWWRYGGLEGHQAAPALAPALAPPPALAVPPVTPYAILPRSFAPAATRSAASCST